MTADETEATFTFGKHAGKAVKNVPIGYLSWVVCECLRIRPSLLLAVVAELRRRGEDVDALLRERADAERHRRERATQDAAPRPADIRPIIDKWYRQLVLDYHPDRGGDTAAMQVINEAHERLLAMLGTADATRAAATRSPW
jgi:hypothetical protein